ncbi:ribosome maturation factor RimP [Clostridiales Family XIII bacterium PM5-7]
MTKKKIKEIVEEISSSFLAENQLILYNVEFAKEGKDWFLRVYIDKSDDAESAYVGTEDCEITSRFLSEQLDELDPIEQNYYLEVSSPGMDRQLTEPWHYDRYVGQLVEVKLYKSVDGKKVLEGTLVGLIDDHVVIKDENDKEMMFPQDQVAKTNLAVVF